MTPADSTASKSYLLAVDQSTSATKAIVFDQKARPVHRVSIDHTQYHPRPGWVEHDASEILGNTIAAPTRVVRESGVTARHIRALAIANQRQTIVAWDAVTGRPLYRALVRQDVAVLESLAVPERSYVSTMAPSQREGLVRGWHHAVEQVLAGARAPDG